MPALLGGIATLYVKGRCQQLFHPLEMPALLGGIATLTVYYLKISVSYISPILWEILEMPALLGGIATGSFTQRMYVSPSFSKSLEMPAS